MRRKLLAFVVGLFTWILVASLLNRLLRIGLPGYSAVEPTMMFTLSMKWARLALGAMASISAGYVVALLAPDARRLPLMLGGLIFAAFLPVHYQLWSQFPIWYHVIFLASIIPLVALGAILRAGRSGGTLKSP